MLIWIRIIGGDDMHIRLFISRKQKIIISIVKIHDVKINAIQDIKKLDMLYNPASLSYTNYVLNDTRINNTGEKALIQQYKEVQNKEIEGNSKIRQVRKYYR